MNLSPQSTQALDASVIVCTWNRSASLRRTLLSLQTQIVPQDVSWEVIVVDNNSSDDTPSVVEEFARSSIGPAIRYCYEKMQGLSYARNHGVTRARAESCCLPTMMLPPEPDWLLASSRE